MKRFNQFLSSNKLFLLTYLTFSSFIILLPAFWNGYPLFYTDSALYILASNLFGPLIHTEDLPFLSGIGYAWFIRIVTWRSTLYLVVFAQALLLNILIYQSFKVLLSTSKLIKFHFPIILILSAFSSMGWTASQLMPDIFTSYLILAIFLFYSWEKKSSGEYIFLSIIIILSILCHLSNITVAILIIGFLCILFLLKRSFRKNLLLFVKRSLLVVVIILTSLLILIGLNNKYYNFNGMSPTSQIFFIARLMDTGFMPEFLNEKCAEKSYEMCRYKDRLPNSYEGFLWDTKGVFYLTGGWDVKAHTEYGQIIFDVLTTPKYLGKFLFNCGVHSIKQIKTFEIGDGMTTVFNKESPQYQAVMRHFDKKEFREDFQNSRQNQGKLKFEKINKINYILLSISLLIILWTFVKNKFDRNMFLFSFIIISGVIINATATSSLSSVFNRFQSRVIWLIPLLAGIYFLAYIYPTIKNSFSRKYKNQNIDKAIDS